MALASISLIISITMTILYSTKLNSFTDGDICIAKKGDPEGLAENMTSVDVHEKWIIVMKFGFGLWMAMIFASLLAMFSGFNIIITVLNLFT